MTVLTPKRAEWCRIHYPAFRDLEAITERIRKEREESEKALSGRAAMARTARAA